ncbi:MBL fold metallo-hydrolase [Salimicrobium flavidum]|uniref:Glyoxylase, beta-lactamase superfamily II n=1 Tax=Salimicrobium flavidum TaxID=570947 RepID=A0A1N7IJ39_9BACI|nr:MBL fold metallo-hydrolase [Salimicrobium flavidum]SIS37001.1 Glyoxylase, beta-lactamase superfamily II [Salimicrobium flavidum]
MRTIQDTIYSITVPTPYAVGDVHLYVLNGKMTTLVDAGVRTEEAWFEFTRQLKEHGIQPEDITQVILTHHHPDHIGLVEYLPNVEKVFAHSAAIPWIDRKEDFASIYMSFFEQFYTINGVPDELIQKLKHSPGKLKDFPSFKIADSVKEGDVVPGHPEWRVIETPGHAQSHISLYRNEDGAFLGGDHLLYHISPNPIVEPVFLGTERARPMIQYRESLQKLKPLSIRRVFPGHGEVFSNADEIIEKRLRQQIERSEKVYEILKTDPAHAFDISKQLFPRQYKKQYALTMSETIGQLDFLLDESKIYKELSGGQEIYYVN